jgi:hypothetical protein
MTQRSMPGRGRWAATPRLNARRLTRRNGGAHARLRSYLWIAAIAAVLGGLLWWVGTEHAAQGVAWLREHRLGCAGFAGIVSAVAIARRRVLKRTEFAKSWLAAVPIRPAAARLEAFCIEMLPMGVTLAGLALLALACAAFNVEVLRLWLSMSAAVAMGAALSYAIPAPKPIDLPPGSRYVPHGRVKRAASIAPSLAALGLWPIRTMFARAQPKVIARAIVPVFVMMPLGTMADTAMVVTGIFVVIGALSLLVPAAISVSILARLWLAPLPVAGNRLMLTTLAPTVAVFAAAGMFLEFFLSVLGVSLPESVRAGIAITLLSCLVAMGGILATVNYRKGRR